jgi:hypothetical protein
MESGGILVQKGSSFVGIFHNNTLLLAVRVVSHANLRSSVNHELF